MGSGVYLLGRAELGCGVGRMLLWYVSTFHDLNHNAFNLLK